jgi:tetratricopeptide (TPR) repeat protein
MDDQLPYPPEGDSNDSDTDAEAGALLAAFQDAVRQGRHEQVETLALQFLAFASEKAGKEPSQDLVLKEEAHRWEAEGEWSKAEAAYRQALALAEAENNPAMEYKAQADLAAAWPLLEPHSSSVMMAGFQSGLANWWSVTAALRHQRGDFPGAAMAVGEAVTYRRRVSQAPQLEGPYKFSYLADSLHKLGLALLAVEDVKGAEEAFQEGRAIREAIGQP